MVTNRGVFGWLLVVVVLVVCCDRLGYGLERTHITTTKSKRGYRNLHSRVVGHGNIIRLLLTVSSATDDLVDAIHNEEVVFCGEDESSFSRTVTRLRMASIFVKKTNRKHKIKLFVHTLQATLVCCLYWTICRPTAITKRPIPFLPRQQRRAMLCPHFLLLVATLLLAEDNATEILLRLQLFFTY